MEEERSHMTEEILTLTLEIITLLTGERCAVVKMTSIEGLLQGLYPPLSGEQHPITAPPPASPTPERNIQQKVLEVISQVMELLTGGEGGNNERPRKCNEGLREERRKMRSGSLEDSEYSDEHQELYKAAMMEDLLIGGSHKRTAIERCLHPPHHPGDSTQEGHPAGGSDKRTAIERRLHPPPHPGDSTQAGQEIPHYGQVLDLIKVEMEEEEISGQTLEEMEERWEAEEISQPEPGFRNLLSGGLSLPQEDSDDLTQDSNLHPGPHSTAASRNPQRSSPDVSANQTAAQLLVCPDCSKSFTSKIALKNHRRIHSERRPHSCYECGKSFKQKTHLSSHQMCHARESHFPCPECGARFSTKSQLDVHSRYHSGGPIHVCPECGKEFAARSKLERHRIQHTGNKPFSCHECHYRTAFRSALTIHLRIHTGERPFACATCGQNFREKFLLYRHQRSKKH